MNNLTKLYSEHIDEIHGKLISIIESTFDDTLSSYEVRAPMPSDCFRTLVTRHIAAFYNAVARIVSPSDLILLFTRLNSIFKQLLSKRLKILRIANDGGPQHGLLTSDLLYYIKHGARRGKVQKDEAGRGLVVSPKFPRVNSIEDICMKT